MIAAASINWTQVIVLGGPAYLGAIFAGLAMLRSQANGRAMRTPSGDSPGEVIERTHALAAVAVAATTGANGPDVDKALAKLNDDPGSPVRVDPAAVKRAAKTMQEGT